MKRKNIFSLLLIIGLLSIALVACGPKATETAAPAAEATEAPVVEEPTEAPA